MMTLITSILAVFISLQLHAASNIELCQSLVAKRVAEADTEASPLSELKEHLPDGGGATVLFKIDLESLQPSVETLYKVTQSGNDLAIPLRFVADGSLIFLAQGQTPALLKLGKLLADNKELDNISFYVLTPKAAAPLSAPRAIVHNEEELEKARGSGESFAAFISNQIVFLLPRTVVDEFGSDLLKAEKIEVGHIRRLPDTWTDWLVKRREDLKKKTIILAGDWAVVSSAAFTRLQELTGDNGEEISPEMSALNQKILDLLEVPPARPAKGTAVKTNCDTDGEDRFTKPVRKLVLKYLSKHRGRTKLNEESGMERAFLALAKLIPNERAAESYRKHLKEAGIVTWEYSSFTHDSAPSIERVTQAWKAFLKAMKNPYADLALNLRNTKEAIKHLPNNKD